ncbi:aminoglycoside phosphotransferase family protein [Hyphobacterium sp.]|uniref:aminoglycoside phosphotransferase family protein n=1 Tax=Hyphobacterium sp. TaxID=2004662 RepID=UPI003BACCE40
MSERESQIEAFLTNAGWASAEQQRFPGDASTRSYRRLVHGDQTAVLMDAPAGAEAPACPPDATPDERAALGYNALARLAGPNLAAFAGLTEELTMRGFSAPRILAADLPGGFLLLEDLGDDLFARAIPAGADEKNLYQHAIDALAAIYRSSFPAQLSAHGGEWHITDYDGPALLAETELLLDWFIGKHLGRAVSDGLRSDWRRVWSSAFAALDTQAPGLALRDYHAENLIWLPDRQGPARTGLIDYQDALFVHPAYDLVSLLEDARRDVPADLAQAMKTRFLKVAHISDADAFDAAYAVLGAQRNAKILGIFVRLAVRDGKPKYLDLLPRVARHFLTDISHPALSEVRALIHDLAPELDEVARK